MTDDWFLPGDRVYHILRPGVYGTVTRSSRWNLVFVKYDDNAFTVLTAHKNLRPMPPLDKLAEI
jgi:hypothetical protein